MDWFFCVYHTQLTYTEIIVSHFESISLCARNRKHAPTVLLRMLMASTHSLTEPVPRGIQRVRYTFVIHPMWIPYYDDKIWRHS